MFTVKTGKNLSACIAVVRGKQR